MWREQGPFGAVLPYTGMHCPTMILYQPCGRPIAHPQYREEPRSQIRAPRVPEDGPLVARALPGHNQGGESETRVSQDWLQHVLDIVSKPSKIRGCSDTFRHAPFICTSAAGHTGSRNQRRSRIERFADSVSFHQIRPYYDAPKCKFRDQALPCGI